MSIVRFGVCPDCGADALGAGALHYSDSGGRVVACRCGSRKPLIVPPYPYDFGARAKNEAALKRAANVEAQPVASRIELEPDPGCLPSFVARLRRWWWRCVRRYDSELCQRCGRPYFAAIGDTWWHADDELWQAIEGGPGGLRCPPCFTREARAAGFIIFWQATIRSRA